MAVQTAVSKVAEKVGPSVVSTVVSKVGPSVVSMVARWERQTAAC